MKFKSLAAALVAGGLLLSGCSSTVQKDGKDVVASIDEYDIFADDLYSSLLNTPTGENALFNYTLSQLIKANFPVDKDMEEYADDQIENIQAQYESSYGDDAESYLTSALATYGYESLDDYRDSMIQSLQYSSMIKKYVKDNYDVVFEDYYTTASPRYISLIKISVADMDNPTDDEKEKLNEVKALLKTNKDFGDIAKSYSDDDSASVKGNLGIVDTASNLSSTYGDNVDKAVFGLKANEVSSVIEEDDGYYILKCNGNDKETLKEELKTIDLTSPLLAYDNYMIYLAFNTYDITYNDDSVKKIIDDYISEALNTRDANRGGNN